MRITVDNKSMTETRAIAEAIEINDQTGIAVEVCNMLGDTIAYVTKAGKIIRY